VNHICIGPGTVRVQTDGPSGSTDQRRAWAREAREELESRRTRAQDTRAQEDRASWDVWIRASEDLAQETKEMEVYFKRKAQSQAEAYFERKAQSQAEAEEMDTSFEREDRDLAYNEALILQLSEVDAQHII
jgi:hypothetical protein